MIKILLSLYTCIYISLSKIVRDEIIFYGWKKRKLERFTRFKRWGERGGRWKGQNCYSLHGYKFWWWQWLFLSTNCGAANAAEGVLVSYGAGSIYSPPLRRGREPKRVFWYRRMANGRCAVHPCLSPPRHPSLFPLFHPILRLFPTLPPSLPAPLQSPSSPFSVLWTHRASTSWVSPHGCVYHKAGIVERPNDTHRYVSSFFFFSSFCLLSSSPLPPLSFDASIPRDMHEDSIYEGMVRGVRYGFSCSTKWLTNGACKIRIEN